MSLIWTGYFKVTQFNDVLKCLEIITTRVDILTKTKDAEIAIKLFLTYSVVKHYYLLNKIDFDFLQWRQI